MIRKQTTLFLIPLLAISISIFSLSADDKKEAAIKSVVSRNDEKNEKEEGKDERVFELRTYTTAEGKLPNLHDRFRDHTIKLFEKHGMKNLYYFTPVDKPNTLTYLLEHKSKKAAKASWNAFLADQDWKDAYKESIKDGKLIIKIDSTYLKTTDYSPVK